MHIILGGTGHVGSATAAALLDAGQEVTIVTHDAQKAKSLDPRAKVAVADIMDPDALRDVLRTGSRALLLNPPAAPDTDTDALERETVRCILSALAGSGLEKVVAQSTYGAQPGERLGDLNTLHELEAGVRDQPIPSAIVRAAYYYTNWDAQLDPIREAGVLTTMYPATLKIPMVSPDDLAREAARLLMASADVGGTVYVEGPSRYSSDDVAAAFATALGRPVETAVVPRDHWEAAFRKLGFSDPAARSYARMTAISVDGDYTRPDDPVRGTVTLSDHIAALTATRPA